MRGDWDLKSLAGVAWAFAVMRPGDMRLFSAAFGYADEVLTDLLEREQLLSGAGSSLSAAAAVAAEGGSPSKQPWSSSSSKPSESDLELRYRGSDEEDETEDAGPRDDLDMRSIRQLFQAHMAHQLACLRGHPGHSPASMAPVTLDACRSDRYLQHSL